MKNCVRLAMFAVACVGVTLLVADVSAKGEKPKRAAKVKPAEETMISEMKLPEKVRATFVDRFPNGVINKLESETDGGVMVWNIEFRDGKSRKKTHIADDGTMLGRSVPITKKTVPKQVMKRFEEVAKKEGAALGDMERLEVSYETKDGKVVKLDSTATHYSLDMVKGGQTTKFVVDEKGNSIDGSKQEMRKAKKAKKAAA